MNLRVLYNVFLVRLGIRQILPSDYINAIPVVESNEPMVKFHDDEDFVKTDEKVFIGRFAQGGKGCFK